MDLLAPVAAQWREFAQYAAATSPTYADWCTRVADDREVLAWLERLPRPKRQPNLVLAAARLHGVPAPGPYDAFRAALLGDGDPGDPLAAGPVATTVRARRTQTNEPGRLATLLPVLAELARSTVKPLALLELGASAGLCLHPDRYAYRWSGEVVGDLAPAVAAGAPQPPVLPCTTSGPVPLPTALPRVAWRGGVDLAPVDLHDDEAVAWLEALVWPEERERLARLRAAVAVARAADDAVLVRGDLREQLPELVDLAGRHGEVVVLHSAVLAYVEPDDRAEVVAVLEELVGRGACRWVSNEAPGVLPGVAATGPALPEGSTSFVLGLDGRAVAWTHPHGSALTWLPPR